MRFNILLSSLLLAAPTLFAEEGSLSAECIQEYKQGHLEKALYYCHGASTHPEAQLILGKIYSLEGMNSPEMRKAYDYFLASANQNQPEAQFIVAVCFLNGLGVPQNSVTAAYWYKQAILNGLEAPDLDPIRSRRSEVMSPEAIPTVDELIRAAEKGLPEAEYQLGLAYSFGKGVTPDDGKAWAWLNKAANQNHQGAQSYLAWMSLMGLGKPENKAEAIQWFLQACQESATTASSPNNELDDILSHPQDPNVFNERTPEAEYLQGIELIESRFNEQDFKDGITLLEKASEGKYTPAQLYLAKLYQDGKLIEKDLKKSAALYTEAAYNGNAQAQYQLGWMYFYGEGVPLDHDEAFEWFSRANEHEARAKEALQFLGAQRVAVELGNEKVKRSFRENFQRAGSYLKSLISRQ